MCDGVGIVAIGIVSGERCDRCDFTCIYKSIPVKIFVRAELCACIPASSTRKMIVILFIKLSK